LKSTTEFTDVFKKDDLEKIVTKVENLINNTTGINKKYYKKNFIASLFKLGIRIQDDEFISQAKQIISNYSLRDQSKIYRQLSDYYLNNEDSKNPIEGRKYLEIAFNHWIDSMESRKIVDPNDMLKNVTSFLKKAKTGVDIGETPTDYFNDDLRMLETLYAYNMHESFKTCIKLCLTFIKSSPLFFQPLLLAFLADHLVGKVENEKIMQYIEKADEIIKNAEEKKVRTPIFGLSGGWSQYYQEKAKILRKIENVGESRKLLDETFEGTKESRERWRFAAKQLDQCLFLGDKAKVLEIINIGVKNLYNPIETFPFSFVYPLIQETPSTGVKQELWEFAREYLKEKFHRIVETFDPEKKPLKYDYLVEILKILIDLNTTEIVEDTSLKIIATLQESILTFTHPKFTEKIRYISTDHVPWKVEPFLNLTLSRTNLQFVITRADYWDYYKTTGKNVEIAYDQFDSTYKKWIGEYRMGNPVNMHLYLNIPYVYASLTEIYSKLGEDELSSLCQQNVDTFREERLTKVQIEPSIRKRDRNWYSNLLTLTKNEMEQAMKTRNYFVAKERLFQAFELIDLKSDEKKYQSDGLALDPLLLSVIQMFELLTKH
jgi:hypothetical protein